MAQLKDLIVTGPSRFLNDLYALTIYEGGVKLEDKYYLASNPSGYTSNAGTVTSVRVQASSPLTSTSSSASSTTLDTTIKFSNQNANLVLAGPASGGAAAPSFRSLAAADIPTLSYSKISGISGTTPIGYSSGAISLSYDSTLQVVSNKLSVKNSVPTGTTDGQILRWDQSESTASYWDDPASLYSAGVGLTKSSTTFSLDQMFGAEFIVGTQTAATGSWTGVTKRAALYDGMQIAYWLPFAGSGNATLNLTLSGGGTTGAVNCYYNGTTRLTTHYGAGNLIHLTYRANVTIGSGTYTGWWSNANYDTNTGFYYNRYIYSNSYKTGTVGAFAYTLLMERADGALDSIVTSSSTGTSKARNTNGFRLPRVLYWHTTSVAANTALSTYGLYEAFTDLIDLRYSFNITTSGLTAKKPIYLVGSLGNDGLFYLNSTWWTQTLPSSADGKLYIHIADAYDGYRAVLNYQKPIYKYVDGKVQEWSQGTEYAITATDASNILGGSNNQVLISNGTKGVWSNAPWGTGTVTSVRVQATSPIASSTSTAQSSTLNTTISLGYDSTLQVVSNKLSVKNAVPTGSSDNQVLYWDGAESMAPFWGDPIWLENPIYNAGEIIIGSSNGDPMALSKGSTGQVLTTTSSGNRVAWQNATVRMNANTGSTALSVLLAPSDVSNGASKEAQYANTSGKQLKFTPSTGNLSGVAQINGSTVPSSPKFTDTLADYITEWDNEYTGEPTGIVKYAYDHTPALYLDGTVSWSEILHSWSTNTNVSMLTMTNTYSGSTNPILTLTSSPVQNSGTIFKLTNNTTQTSNNWLSALDIMAPNMASNSNMNYANFTIFNCGKAASENNRGSLVYHHTADGSVYNCLTMGFYGNDHVFRVYAYGGAWIYSSLYVENGNKVATESWVNSHFVPTCLIKGTKILMADGTEKNIEDVKRGDEVKSIDINSGKIITAMVVSCEKTGLNHEYTTHLFDNGSYIVTYGQHSVYNKTLGHPIDISKFRIGDETYDAEGNVITYAGNMRYYDRSTDVAHYDINTSNNLYFANGILNGKNVFAKYRYMRRENMDIPDSILAVLNRQETANKPAIGYETDSNYFRAIAAKLKEKSTIAKRIEEAKQKLADSDYLVAKFTEGLIGAVDWLKAKAERSNWRTAINNDEPLLEAAENAIKAIKAKYQTDESSVKDRFELFSAWDNAALEYYREWLTKIKPIDAPGPLTEEERHGSYANQDLT